MTTSQDAISKKSANPPNARERLLQAAIDVFGKHGFNGATTRMITQTAGVNISAIPYYYTGKEGLYHAVVEYIAAKLKKQLQHTIDEIQVQASATDISPQRAMALLEALLTKVTGFMLGSSDAFRFARIILREQLDPSAAYDTIYGRFMAPSLSTVARLIMIITGISSSREAHIRALAVVGQILSFRIARETMVRMLNLKGYTPEETEEIRRLIIEQTRAALTGLS